ncbi:MAG: DUF2256 domain-containing protein [Saprospiraceae bacterium]|nr:DUF2256 domain-containing protein [Saprospiraceae bacterium]MBP9194639.1 DUF2256 domain-containing protein [Saprospiraceae bacterium]
MGKFCFCAYLLRNGFESGIVLEKSSYKGNKSYLPQKICVVCGKPFTWRKKWEKNWENVKYCSDKCSRQKNKTKA